MRTPTLAAIQETLVNQEYNALSTRSLLEQLTALCQDTPLKIVCPDGGLPVDHIHFTWQHLTHCFDVVAEVNGWRWFLEADTVYFVPLTEEELHPSRVWAAFVGGFQFGQQKGKGK